MSAAHLLGRTLIPIALVSAVGACGEPEVATQRCDATDPDAGCADIRADVGICNPADPTREAVAPFCVFTGWGSGAIADSWSYEIRIGPGPAGRLVVETRGNTYVRAFDVSEEAVRELRDLHASLGLDGSEPDGDMMVGGSPVRLAVVVDGVAMTLGSWLESPAEGRKQELAARTAALVPQALWADLRAASGQDQLDPFGR